MPSAATYPCGRCISERLEGHSRHRGSAENITPTRVSLVSVTDKYHRDVRVSTPPCATGISSPTEEGEGVRKKGREAWREGQQGKELGEGGSGRERVADDAGRGREIDRQGSGGRERQAVSARHVRTLSCAARRRTFGETAEQESFKPRDIWQLPLVVPFTQTIEPFHLSQSLLTHFLILMFYLMLKLASKHSSNLCCKFPWF